MTKLAPELECVDGVVDKPVVGILGLVFLIGLTGLFFILKTRRSPPDGLGGRFFRLRPLLEESREAG